MTPQMRASTIEGALAAVTLGQNNFATLSPRRIASAVHQKGSAGFRAILLKARFGSLSPRQGCFYSLDPSISDDCKVHIQAHLA